MMIRRFTFSPTLEQAQPEQAIYRQSNWVWVLSRSPLRIEGCASINSEIACNVNYNVTIATWQPVYGAVCALISFACNEGTVLSILYFALFCRRRRSTFRRLEDEKMNYWDMHGNREFRYIRSTKASSAINASTRMHKIQFHVIAFRSRQRHLLLGIRHSASNFSLFFPVSIQCELYAICLSCSLSIRIESSVRRMSAQT